eukprot:m.112568 g.112568  ORF g.112568 m.112568 type:complete len:91 (+) comp51842_c0_seq10:152-424(+)
MQVLSLQKAAGLLLAHDSMPLYSVQKMRDLLAWVRTTLIAERPELFMQNDTIRPGILVLINDTDWELTDELDYVLREGDSIVFISTLHGG